MFPTYDEISTWLPHLLGGLSISLQVTALSLLIGIPFGLVLALGVLARNRALKGLSLFLVEIGRGAPALVLLQFIYFGLPTTGVTLGSYAAAVIALAWNTGAYTSEIIRASLQSVAHGQREAAVALGLNRLDELRYVLLPQGLRVALPALLGFSILIFQGTSLCFTIALPELVSRAYEIGSTTFRYFPALLSAGALYACISIPAALFVSHVEKRAGLYAHR
ncbi:MULTISPECIES: amino acid ABC transporter permease [Rhizobium/Agrobacterium group]|uniref:Amino acid ABC transporter permease n=2 Tax=Rhizobium/Agrobacterium group TaxID=227290 RepID=A0A9X3KQQ5_9HYPH|nr:MULTISPECIES: amino acid ABC transporter permease [Rhizobium/Agrobacterium group]MBO9126241.1 amino acid ABC transporter permease [Rhizobium sp. 16-488-2b]MBO9176825.1 amino acid ABC transporter permease [Rhizobium sp. 16-488-2a]MBO9197394.1 amino acid ABC transporter permease [Rhizobium sp. 16-449-1b]MCZ7466745.1 amino acid ABC transporter permease [Rhizobium rhizogenes]MCZ7939225.1 amino acid ABC transporter permease [Agrobacterium salinitolerans]